MGLISLQNFYNNNYVCAEMDQGGALYANREWRRDWETFEMIDLGNDLVALKNAHNGKFVCAELDNGAALVANRDWIKEWETFEMKSVVLPPSLGGPPQVAFRSIANGCWVCADVDEGGRLRANRHWVREWERFYFYE